MMTPLPILSQAFSLIKQDEKQKQGSHFSGSFIGNVKENHKFLLLFIKSPQLMVLHLGDFLTEVLRVFLR